MSQYNRAIEEAKQRTANWEKENELINATLNNISGSSLRQLETSLKLVNEQLKDTDHNSDAFKELSKKAKQLKHEIAGINKEQDLSNTKWMKFVQFLNTNWGALTQIIASISAVSFTLRKCSADFAKMDEQMVDVIKYTGLTKTQVEELNETFKQMNTRTSREKLNQLAGDAGRLGITSQEMAAEFVDAADKINVALGDDLGDDAVKNIGKLAQMFGDDKTKGLRGAMLATGSVVNELAQSSSASAGYLVDFTARLAGVGKQAGLTQQQIMGFASVLDQNMQQDEAAATAMQNLIAKMFQDPAKFAALAGKSVKEFSSLLKNDANEALLQFFGAMKQRGGFDSLAPMFDQMGMDGSRCAAVFSVMADKLADIKTAQNIANRAYADGSSVINEFNTQMTSAQAKLDIAKKKFKDLSIELGRELQPVVQYTVSSMSLLVKVLYQVIVFTKNHIGVLSSLAGAIAIVTLAFKAQTVAAKLNAAATATVKGVTVACNAVYKGFAVTLSVVKVAFYLLTGQIKKAKVAMDALRIATMKNPYAAMLTVVLALGAGIYALVKAIRAHNKAAYDNMLAVRKMRAEQKDMLDAQKEVNQNTAEEKTRLSQLTNIINSNVYSYEEKKRAMIALEKLVPGYHRNLNNEAQLVESNNKAIKQYVDNLNNAAMAQALFSRMVELQGKKFDLDQEIARHKLSAKAVQAEINRHPDYYNAYETTFSTSGGSGGPSSIHNVRPTQANIAKHKELDQWNAAVKESVQSASIVEARIKNIYRYLKQNVGVAKQFNAIVAKGGSGSSTVSPDWNPNTSKVGNYVDSKEAKKREAAAKKHEREMKAATKAAYQAEIKAAKDKTDQEQAYNIIAYRDQKKSYKEFLDAQHDIAIRGYEALESIYKKYGTEYGQWQEKIADEQLQRSKDHSKGLLSDIEQERQRHINAAYNDYHDVSSEIYHNEEALNERLYEIDMTALADRVAALQEGSEEWLDTRAEMTQRETEHDLYLRQHYDELLSQYKEQWAAKDIAEQQRITLAGLDLLHSKGLLKEKEYQEMLQQIKLHYAEQQSAENLRNSKGEQFNSNAASAYNTAHNNAKASWSNDHPEGSGVMDFITSDVDIYKSTLDNIKSMEQDGLVSHQEAMAAMGEATADMCNGLVAKFQAAMDAISPLMSAMSSYYSAQSDYEVTVTEKKYEKLINAAGNNTAKTKKLEEQKEKEVAKIKSKYARKQAAMQVAQAIAQTALSAIAAYSSAMKGVPYPANMVLAPIAAGIAAAAGAIQIATIKKQQQAQEAGYYEGGFTGGSRYRREAGVVHEGEFVANHKAVNNPQVLPALRLIDEAQRNNTVSSLTAADISRSLGQANATVVSAPSVTVNTDNSELSAALGEARDVIGRLSAILADGIHADVYIDGDRGVAKNLDRYNQLNSRT
ncbi:phage tail tape measure protein [Prevotella sp.]|uniref:phage tail tape measure protein n=1 Tax=Prevotella sp. TaxID=59823 RepID=UPI003F7F3FEE